jgi:hypothetical protein
MEGRRPKKLLDRVRDAICLLAIHSPLDQSALGVSAMV